MKLRIRLLFVASMVAVVIVVCAKEGGAEKNPADVPTDSPPGEEPSAIIPTCPQQHTDSIIPIIYGFPTPRTFEQADSGLVALGGCEMNDDSPLWHCKKHNLSF